MLLYVARFPSSGAGGYWIPLTVLQILHGIYSYACAICSYACFHFSEDLTSISYTLASNSALSVGALILTLASGTA